MPCPRRLLAVARPSTQPSKEGSPDFPPGTPAPVNLQPQPTVPEVRVGSGVKLDPNAAQTILDTPPVGGINPRFRPPQR